MRPLHHACNAVGRHGIEPCPRRLKGGRSTLELASLLFWSCTFHGFHLFLLWGMAESNGSR
jgi:hypothetical protein